MHTRRHPRLRLSLLSCAVALAATGATQSAHAVDLCTGKTSIIVSSSTAGNDCTLDTVNATLTVSAGARITDGVSVVQTGATIGNGGTISNIGSTALYFSVDLEKSLSNSGIIQSEYYDAYAVNIDGDVSGTISNSGRISGIGMDSSWVGASGLYISGALSGKLVNSGRIEGRAMADSSYAWGYGAYVSGEVSGSISNSGVISGTAQADDFAYAYGLYLDDELSGPLSNAGIISATATAEDYAYAYGLYLDEGLSGPLSNTGIISATATAEEYRAYASALYISGDASSSLANSGRIMATAAATSRASAYGLQINGELSARLSNSGVISAAAEADYSAEASAVQLYSVGATGEIINSGLISASVKSLYSSGTAYGIYVSNDYEGRLVNTGRIEASAAADESATAYALYVGGVFTGSLQNSGVISAIAASGEDAGSAYAVYLDQGLGTTGSVVNTGTISATAQGRDGATATALRVRSGWFSTLNSSWVYGAMGGNAQIVNSGLIEGRADGGSDDAYGWAVWVSGSLYDNAQILNNAGGVIRAVANSRRDDASATALYTGDLRGSASVVNHGVITAEATSLRSEAYAYGIRTGTMYENARLVNTGSISAIAHGATSATAYGIETGSLSGEAVISNSGSITARAVSPGSSEAYAYGIRTGSLEDDARIVNSGTITAYGEGESSATVYGIYSDYLYDNASIINSGTITVTAIDRSSSAEAYGLYTYDLNGSSILRNSGSITVTARGTNGDASATAYGIYAGYLYGNAALTNSGVIKAHAVSDGYSADAYGIYAGSLSTNAVISNSGRLDVSARGELGEGYAAGISAGWVADNASVTNTGVIQVQAEGSTSATAYGLRVDGAGNAATVVNSGVIVATAINHHDSSAEAYGIYASVLYDTASLTNSGLVVARAHDRIQSAGGSDATAYGALTYHLTGGASLTNSGRIIAEADSLNGEAYAYGIFAGTLDGTVENTGSIVATARGPRDASAYGVYAWDGSGTLNNSGTIVGALELHGTVSAQNSGKLLLSHGSYVGGNFTQLAGGETTLMLRSDNGGLYVNGTGDFTGSNLIRIGVAPGAGLADGEILSDVVYAGTLVAPAGFDVRDMSAFWDFDVIDTTNGFDLEMHKVDPTAALAGAGYSLSSSQAALVEGALNGDLAIAYGSFVDALSMAPTAAAAAAVLEQVGPALTGAGSFATRVASAPASNAISARQGETRGASSGDAFNQNAVWIKPFLGMASQDGANGVSGYDVDTTGFVIGIDGDLNDSTRLGVAVATAQSNGDGGVAGLDIDTTQFTLYGSYALSSATSLDADLSYGANRYDSNRSVGFAGTRAIANYDGTQLALGATLSHRMSLGEKAALVPAVSLRYSKVDIDGYTETGAGVFNLSVADASDDAFLLAAKAGYELTLANKGVFLASLGLGYDSIDRASATASLGNGSGPTFVSNGIEPESMLVTGGLGYRYVTSKNLEINAAYDLESRSDFLAQTLSVKFRLPF